MLCTLLCTEVAVRSLPRIHEVFLIFATYRPSLWRIRRQSPTGLAAFGCCLWPWPTHCSSPRTFCHSCFLVSAKWPHILRAVRKKCVGFVFLCSFVGFLLLLFLICSFPCCTGEGRREGGREKARKMSERREEERAGEEVPQPNLMKAIPSTGPCLPGHRAGLPPDMHRPCRSGRCCSPQFFP